MDALPFGKGSRAPACLLLGGWCGLSALCGASALAQNVTEVSGLSFGTLALTSAGTVTVRPDGSRGQTGGVLVLNQATAPMAAQFSIKGKRNSVYAITLPLDGTVALSNGAGQTMSLGGFVASPSTGILSSNGSGQFSVGATLSMGTSQAKGRYSGTFNVTVNYQ